MVSANELMTQTIGQDSIPAAWLFGARTRLVDSWSPQVEVIRLPPIRYKPGNVLVHIACGKSVGGRLDEFDNSSTVDENVYFDFRHDCNTNIAHITTRLAVNASVTQEALEKSGLEKYKLTLLLRSQTPGYCRDVINLFGWNSIFTDESISGRFMSFSSNCHMPEWRLAADLLPQRISSKVRRDTSLPSKVFLACRGSRSLLNGEQVESFLNKKGYVSVFLEDLPVSDQFAIVSSAKKIVAVHGAALAGLALRTRVSDFSLQVTELFGPYIVSIYRELTHFCGGRWTGVRGRNEGKCIDAFNRGAHPRAFQDRSFCVDINSLDYAIDSCETGQLPSTFVMEL